MMFEKIAEIIANVANCKIEDVTPEANLNALGIDSLKAISMIFEIEEAFDIEIPNEAVHSIVTVDDVISKLKEAVQK